MMKAVAFIFLIFFLSAPLSQARAEGKIYRVSGTSMVPTLAPGDPVEVIPEEDLHRGDLVAVRFQKRAHPMVKRIIAVAGDRVEIVKGSLRVNGTEVRRAKAARWGLLMKQLSRYGGAVPAGNLLVLGDHPAVSFDSRRFGLVAESQVTGKVYPRKVLPRQGKLEGPSIEGSSMR